MAFIDTDSQPRSSAMATAARAISRIVSDGLGPRRTATGSRPHSCATERGSCEGVESSVVLMPPSYKLLVLYTVIRLVSAYYINSLCNTQKEVVSCPLVHRGQR
ncbi:Uncharacterised protein [Mycobacteroides abscessus subsp. abscessus]|nr:Uncharacterised protein [Mycobacteroides abscessus subsp. abscessus]